MYKIPKDEETKEFISASAKLLTDGDEKFYGYDTEFLNDIFGALIDLSQDCARIKQFFSDENIIIGKDWSYMEWALLCIGYCYAKQPNPQFWDKIPATPEQKTRASTNIIGNLFGKDRTFWVAFLSKQMFDFYNDDNEFSISDFTKFTRLAAHKGALLLEEKYLDLQKAYKDEPYKAVSQFLLDLAELAGRNVPQPPQPPIDNGENTGSETQIGEDNTVLPLTVLPLPPDVDISVKLKEILKKCKIPAETVILSNVGMRYDIYEVKFYKATDLDKKLDEIAQHLGYKDRIMAGGIVAGKSLTQYLKILKEEKDWKIYEDNEFQRALQEYKDNFELPICLGLDELGEPIFKDFSQAPHAIIGGTTRSGKSVALKGMIHSLLTLTPKENLELFILDPKKVEYQKLSQKYDNLSLITENDEMVGKINELADEMEKRYSILQEKMVEKLTDITTENRPFKFIVAIIDELADLLDQEEDLAEPLTRIAQKGAAAGIHLLLSTQRPDADALGRKGSRLRANLPTKIGFKVDKEANSKIILDEIGAEKLAGKGDHFIKWFGGEKVFLHGYNIKE